MSLREVRSANRTIKRRTRDVGILPNDGSENTKIPMGTLCRW
jgi:hypothetical protein